MGCDYKLVKEGFKKLGVDISDEVVKEDVVNNPKHYEIGGISTYDFIKAKGLSYPLGNVIKYVSRAAYKGKELEDLEKAQWYLNSAINEIKEELEGI
jgi:hypothetical protein